jgi:hypothetical protein
MQLERSLSVAHSWKVEADRETNAIPSTEDRPANSFPVKATTMASRQEGTGEPGTAPHVPLRKAANKFPDLVCYIMR